MKLNDKAILYIPSEESQESAFNRTTHMAISAHQDDVEIMAQQGIISCYQKSDCGFAAVVITNGSGSPRIGEYEHFSDEQMMELRCEEQNTLQILAVIQHWSCLTIPVLMLRNQEQPPYSLICVKRLLL